MRQLNAEGSRNGQTRMTESGAIDAASTIRLLEAPEAFHSMTTLIHVFLDNARYHHAKVVQEWLSRPERISVLHFVPFYRPHLHPNKGLWALTHEHLTHNKTYPTWREFVHALLGILRHEVAAK